MAHRPTTPLWRDEHKVKLLLQALFLGAVISALYILYRNMMSGLEALGLTFSFGFLQNEAGFGISEGIAYQPSDSYARAFWVGIVNSVRVCLFGVLFASVIGVLVGVARLSSNWIVRTLARVYVEVFRNVPLLLQLLFWYGAVILRLPPVRQAVSVGDAVYLSQRGLYVPRFVPTDSFLVWRWYILGALGIAAAVYFYRVWVLRRAERPGFPAAWAVPVFLLLSGVAWFVMPTAPLGLEYPVLQRFNFEGGMWLSPEFAGLLLGLSVYTGAFIAEVVRGGIQSVAKGQREAAMALGLRSWRVMYLVVLPQAFRIIIPPLTSQYLNLAKNSSLAVAIGFPELFNIGTTTMNQSGQTIPVFAIIMASYLGISLITSIFMNWYNRRVRLVER